MFKTSKNQAPLTQESKDPNIETSKISGLF